MSDLIVGSDECTFDEVSSILNGGPASGRVQFHWKDIVRGLKLNDDDAFINAHQFKLTMDMEKYSDVFNAILKQWHANAGTDGARLQVLIDLLEKLKLKAAAEALQNRYCSQNGEKVAHPKVNGSSEDLNEKRKEHILANIIGLTQNTTVSAMLTARALSAKMLTQEEIQTLENKKVPHEMSRSLYLDYMLKKPGLYDTLVDILKKELQTGAVEILEKIS